MRDITHKFYPMTITHSRYGGTYSGGEFILIAGVRNPKENTNVTGSDPDCMAFWQAVEKNGPIIEKQIDGKTKEIYVDSGTTPSSLFHKYRQVCQTRVNSRLAEIVTRVLRDYPQIEKQARENPVDLHKLQLVAESRYREESNTGVHLVGQELVDRFLEYTSLPSLGSLSDEQKEELREFGDKVTEKEGLTLPIAYNF